MTDQDVAVAAHRCAGKIAAAVQEFIDATEAFSVDVRLRLADVTPNGALHRQSVLGGAKVSFTAPPQRGSIFDRVGETEYVSPKVEAFREQAEEIKREAER